MTTPGRKSFLQKKTEDLDTENNQGGEKINQVQNQRSALEALLSSNLLRRRVEIVALLASGGSEPFEEDLSKVTDELKHVVEQLTTVEQRLKELNVGIAKAQKEENKLRKKLGLSTKIDQAKHPVTLV